MFNFAPLGNFVLFVLAIVIIIGGFLLAIVANIVYYLGWAIGIILCIGLVSCTIRQSYIKIKSLLKKKDVEKELN